MHPSTRKLLLLFLILFFPKRIWIWSAFVSLGNRKPRVWIVEGAGFKEPQGGVQGVWVRPCKEGMSYSPEQSTTGCLCRPAHGEGEDVLFHRRAAALHSRTPHCSSCCFPSRVGCSSAQHTQVQSCFQFGKAPPDPIEPVLKHTTYQINSLWNIFAPRSGPISSINNDVFPQREDFQDFHMAKHTFFLFVFPPPSLGNPSLPWDRFKFKFKTIPISPQTLLIQGCECCWIWNTSFA